MKVCNRLLNDSIRSVISPAVGRRMATVAVSSGGSSNTGLSSELAGLSASSIHSITLEDRYGAHNYHPLPVVLTRGKGMMIFK